MLWIVLKEEKGKIKLVSKKPSNNERPGLLPKGSYLTIEQKETNSKFILRVDESYQHEPYAPSPMIIDMDLEGLYGDRKCQNIIYAYRVKDITSRNDGQIDFILPQSIARRSNQEEVNIALSNIEKGPIVFPATIHAAQNQLLVDDNFNYITAKLPEDIFFYQMQICGKTGSGKTVCTKYLAQYFVEKYGGAVLAINVKDVDFLQMERPSNDVNESIEKEWNAINEKSHGVYNFWIYYPANTTISSYRGIALERCERITLDVKKIEPESLIGLLSNISDIGAQYLPDIFRYWKKKEMEENDSFGVFEEYFRRGMTNPTFSTLNIRGDESSITLHHSTFQNILRCLTGALEFFDNPDAKFLDVDDILYKGKLSVVNVAGEKGIQFGSILLRDLLKRIVVAKSQNLNSVPILVIIDEVHQFYSSDSSLEALGALDTICRTGRSQEIGVIFSSQNQEDLPRGLSSVINTKIFFKSDIASKHLFGVSSDEISTLRSGYAVANIHNLPQLKILKFPLSFAGVIRKGERDE